MTKRNGYSTRQRRHILDLLTASRAAHMTVEEIMSALKERGRPVGRTTIYRYLESLAAQGLVRKYQSSGGSSACFELLENRAACAEHFHFKCTACGQLFHLECHYLEDMADHLLSDHQLSIDSARTVLYGTCGPCTSLAIRQKEK